MTYDYMLPPISIHFRFCYWIWFVYVLSVCSLFCSSLADASGILKALHQSDGLYCNLGMEHPNPRSLGATYDHPTLC